jgi:phosphate transport system substrate-binding protein
MKTPRLALFVPLAALALGATGCGGPEGDVTLQGSGATFPAPLYKRWYLEYYKQYPEVRVNYTPIGSGAGIRQFTSGLVVFGASDAGISKDEIAKLPEHYGGVLALPMTAGGIVLSYNVPGVSEPIRLSREAYVNIFLREITNWNDDAIAKSNPGVKLPDLNITLVTRADSSGTSYAFTNHMNAVAESLKVKWTPTVNKSPTWKESISAQGNDGVAALIQLTPGGIGYLEYGYADLAHMPMAALENRSGKYVLPDKEGKAGRKALEGAKLPPDLQVKVPDPENAEAYPIVTYTWVLCRKKYPADKANEVEKMKDVLRFCLEDRQQDIAEQLGYLRLPKEVVEKVRAAIDDIKVAS